MAFLFRRCEKGFIIPERHLNIHHFTSISDEIFFHLVIVSCGKKNVNRKRERESERRVRGKKYVKMKINNIIRFMALRHGAGIFIEKYQIQKINVQTQNFYRWTPLHTLSCFFSGSSLKRERKKCWYFFFRRVLCARRLLPFIRTIEQTSLNASQSQREWNEIQGEKSNEEEETVEWSGGFVD